jgi:hypothetical protein
MNERITYSAVAIIFPAPAIANEFWVCSFTEKSSPSPTIVKYIVENEYLVDSDPNDIGHLQYRSLENNSNSVTDSYLVSSMNPDHNKPDVRAYAVIIDKQSPLYKASHLLMDGDPKIIVGGDQTVNGSCMKSDSLKSN